jgi:hypothetical protein
MYIQTLRCYYLYGIPLREQLHEAGELRVSLCAEDLRCLGKVFDVRQAPIPAFYTEHYRREHTPYLITDKHAPQKTYIPVDVLRSLELFYNLDITQDIHVSWEFRITEQSIGLLTICLDIQGAHDPELYRLGGLHLNPAYTVVATHPISHLWARRDQTRPELVTLDELARTIHQYVFESCGMSVYRYAALRHEIQLPFMALEVETECATQAEFIAQEGRTLANFVFKPICWEVEGASTMLADQILSPDRIWSIAEDTLVVTAYEGTLYLRILSFHEPVMIDVSGFHLAGETSVRHSFELTVSDYYLLRVIDHLLDEEINRFREQFMRNRIVLKNMADDSGLVDLDILTEVNKFIIDISDLRFLLVDLMEELDNPDKLVDEEWHIILLDRFNTAFNMKAWRDSIDQRLENLCGLAQTLALIHENYVALTLNRTTAEHNRRLVHLTEHSQHTEDRLKRVNYVLGGLALVELVGLIIGILLDDQNPMVLKLETWFHLSPEWSHLVATGIVMFVLGVPIIWIVRRVTQEEEEVEAH